MNTQKYHFAIVVLLPVTTASQSADRDLGIVRLRYVTIVVRNYDEALKWYTNVLGLEKTEDGTFGLASGGWLLPRGAKRTLRSSWKLPSLTRPSTKEPT